MFLEQVAERLQKSQLGIGMGRTEENDEDEEDEEQQPARPPPAMRSSAHQQENKMDYCFSDCESRPHNRPAMERLVQQLVDSSNKGPSDKAAEQVASTAGEARKKRRVRKRAAPRRSAIDAPNADGSVGLRSLTISNRQPRNIRSHAIVRPYRPFTCFGDESFGAPAAAEEPCNRDSLPPVSDSRERSVEASDWDYSSDEDYEPLIELVAGQEPEPDLLALRRQQLLFIKGKSEPPPELEHSDDEGATRATGRAGAAAAEQSSDEELPSAPQFEAIFSDAEEPSATPSGESDGELVDEECEQAVEEVGTEPVGEEEDEEAVEQDEVLELDAALDANRALSKTNCLNRKFSAPVGRPHQLHSPVRKSSSVAPTGSTPPDRDDILVVESPSEIAHKTCEAVSSIPCDSLYFL